MLRLAERYLDESMDYGAGYGEVESWAKAGYREGESLAETGFRKGENWAETGYSEGRSLGLETALGESQAFSPVVAPVGEAPQAAPSRETLRKSGFPVDAIRLDFPILSEKVDGKPLVWLDNAATTQKPRQVISRISEYYERENSNVHRAAHALAARSTDAYELARSKTAAFIGASGPETIVFARGTTEAINLVAQSYVKPLLRPGDEIIVTWIEHHANIVPWQLIAQETGAAIRPAPVDETGQVIISEFSKLFNSHTRFVSLAHVSNALGTIVPVEELTRIAHGHGIPVLVDGAQSAPHMPINVSAIDADFFVFSGHKICGPTGIGALYGRSELLEKASPWQGGGNMIADVTFGRTTYQKAPAKFEAGTGNIADAVGMGAAIDYLTAIGMDRIAAYEHELVEFGTKELSKIKGLRQVGTARRKAGILSFVLDGFSNEEVGKRLSESGIAVRAGHHCAQPALRRFGLEGTVRPSVAFYNTFQELETLARRLSEMRY
jgi:cysteine desulfurase/selenocysteine lyase